MRFAGEMSAGMAPLSWHRIDKYGCVVALCLGAGMFAVHGQLASLIDDAMVLILLAGAALVAVAWQVLDTDAHRMPMAPLVALVGCDGSGKTTLSGDLLDELIGERRTALCYLGLGSGALGERLKRVPLIGHVIERRVANKAKQARSKDAKIPGLCTAVVVYAFSLARLRRFRRMLAMRRDGVTVITDRYPQTEVPGFYDGPGLSAARPGNRLVAALARNERRMYDWMASFHPDVVIRLNVDVDTAYARKPDHKYELLRQKVDATAALRFDGARIVDLDSRQAYAKVRDEAARVVRQTLRAPLVGVAA